MTDEKDIKQLPVAYVSSASVHSYLSFTHSLLLSFFLYRWILSLIKYCKIDGRTIVISLPFIFLFIFFLLPFFFVLKTSFTEQIMAAPPYSSIYNLIDNGSEFYLQVKINLMNYVTIFADPMYIRSYGNSLKIAFISTVFTLLIGFPIAYAIARASEAYRATLLMLVIIPFWTSMIIRIYALIGILKNEGFLNHLLIKIRISCRNKII